MSLTPVEFAIVSPDPCQWIIAVFRIDQTTEILPGEYLTADEAREALAQVSQEWLSRN